MYHHLITAVEEKNTCDLKISPDKVFPFSFPIFSDEDDPLVSNATHLKYPNSKL